MYPKKTLFLLPGFLCDERYWEAQVKALEPYADVIVPSFKGKSSLKSMAQSVLDSAPEKFSVVGHSMGGRVAFELMHIAPDRIDKFAVMDTAVHPLQADEKSKRQLLVDIARKEGMSALAKEWCPPIISPRHWGNEAIIELIYQMAEAYSFTEFEGQIKALLDRGDQTKYLDAITHHVLLICGDEDTWSPVEQHEEMAKHLASSELKIVEKSGHMVTLEEPEQVNKILIDWIVN